MMVQPDVSICTVAEGADGASVARMLKTVASMGDLVEAEAVVATSMVAQTLDSLEREFPRVKWVETRPGNRAFLRNQALPVATGRYLAFWDPSWEVTEACLRSLVDFMDETPDAGLAAPALWGRDGERLATAGSFPGIATVLAHCLGLRPGLPSSSRVKASGNENAKPVEVDWLRGDVLLVRREALEEVGGFLEEHSRLEELEWCLRIRRTGWHIHFLGKARALAEAGGAGAGKRSAGQGGAEVSALFLFLLRKWFGGRAFGLTRR